ncbi:hypothetical protein M9458_008984, partial [Cirrhinus mrigala]
TTVRAARCKNDLNIEETMADDVKDVEEEDGSEVAESHTSVVSLTHLEQRSSTLLLGTHSPENLFPTGFSFISNWLQQTCLQFSSSLEDLDWPLQVCLIRVVAKLGVIELPMSEWSRLVVIVLKKDGSLHVCIDFHKLSAQFQFDAYPMLQVDDLLEKIGKAKYITTLDPCKGNWQEPLEPTASTASETDHEKEAGLTLNVGNYHLGIGQLHPQVNICQSPTLKTKNEVRSFLELVGWYRRFVPNFSSIAAPLNNLLNKCVTNPIPWTEDCKVAFKTLKEKIPDFTKSFLVQVDASAIELGAGNELLPRETHYSGIEKECHAI